MKGDLPVRRQTYSDRTRYMVYVLWLHGSTQATVAKAARLRIKQVAGIIARSEYSNRAGLSLDDRRRMLGELYAIRVGEDGVAIDGGILPDEVFRPRALTRGRA